MKIYEVLITETLQKRVLVEAENEFEAETLAKYRYNKAGISSDYQEYILDSSDFVEVNFDITEKKGND